MESNPYSLAVSHLYIWMGNHACNIIMRELKELTNLQELSFTLKWINPPQLNLNVYKHFWFILNSILFSSLDII